MLRQRGWVACWVSVTHRYCFRTAKPILKLFNRLVATSFWFLVAPAPIPSSKGNPLSGAINTRVIGDFRRISPFISETVRDRPMVTMER